MNITIVAVALEIEEPQQKDEFKLENEIQERILNLSAKGIDLLMHTLGFWGEDKQLLNYTPTNVAKLIRYANERGLGVSAEIDKGRDYYIIGEKTSKDWYEIYGLVDTFEEFADLLDLDELIMAIAVDKNKQKVLEYIEMLEK